MENWNWDHLARPDQFKWIVGVTPFSELTIVFGAMGAYLVVIFALQAWMKNRKAMDLTNITRVHNVILCLWSFVMCIGTIIPTLSLYQNHGARALLCGISKDTPMMVGLFAYWRYHYYLSKYYELFDTVILVLKKKNLIFLHVYHHCIMVFISWIWISANYTTAWWGVATNTLVHVFMYYYYFVATMNVHPWWKRYITSGQIVQFIVGLAVGCVHLYLYWSSNGDCGGDIKMALFSQTVAFSFLLLFINFYWQTYKKGGAERKGVVSSTKPKAA